MKVWNFIVFAALLVMALFGGVLVLEVEDWKPVDFEDWVIKIAKIALFVVAPLGIILWQFMS